MEKYTINTDFKGFKAGQQATVEELVKALEIPLAVSDSDILFTLCMAGIITCIVPQRFSKDIFPPQDDACGIKSSFKAVYSLIDEQTMMYSSDIEGLPDAMIEELTELGYSPFYSDGKEGMPYLELEGGVRFYAGDEVVSFVEVDNSSAFIKVITLDDQFFREPNIDGQRYFPDMTSVVEFVVNRSSKKDVGTIKIPVTEKRFSVVDIQKFINASSMNNGSPFANRFSEEIIEAALAEVA